MMMMNHDDDDADDDDVSHVSTSLKSSLCSQKQRAAVYIYVLCRSPHTYMKPFFLHVDAPSAHTPRVRADSPSRKRETIKFCGPTS